MLLPYSNLVKWICKGMACTSCRIVIAPRCLKNDGRDRDESRFTMCFKGGLPGEEAEFCEDGGRNDYRQGDAILGHGCRDKRSVSKYAANLRLLAAMQLVDGSQTTGALFTGVLDLAPSVFQIQWFNVGEDLADKHDDLANGCIFSVICRKWWKIRLCTKTGRHRFLGFNDS